MGSQKSRCLKVFKRILDGLECVSNGANVDTLANDNVHNFYNVHKVLLTLLTLLALLTLLTLLTLTTLSTDMVKAIRNNNFD